MRKHYRNLYPHPPHSVWRVLWWQLGFGPREHLPQPVAEQRHYQPAFAPPDLARLHEPDPKRVQVTWIGHATFLIQHQGRNILTDPILGDCWGPLPLPQLRRAAPPGLAFEQWPKIQGVAISHCHYDHLDAPTIRMLGSRPTYWVPAGLAAWFRRRGHQNVTELNWWQSASIADGFEIHCVPAQHFSARGLFDRNRTLWCGWVFRSRERTIYFAGDTGYCPLFSEIGQRFGPVDVAMIPIGAYRPRWIMQAMHANPDEAVQIHLDVRSRFSIAAHWGTFPLTAEPLNEPPALLQRALAERRLPSEQFRTLRFGETVEV